MDFSGLGKESLGRWVIHSSGREGFKELGLRGAQEALKMFR
jgi:hypothetical protein